MGADAVKWQFFSSAEIELAERSNPNSRYTERIFDVIRHTELSLGQFKDIKAICDDVGIEMMVTPFMTAERLKLIDPLVKRHKIRERDSGNAEMLMAAFETGKDIYVSRRDWEGPPEEVGEVAHVYSGLKQVFCFPAEDNYVLTQEGAKEINHVCMGDRVLTHLGRWQKVTNVMKRWYEGPLVGYKARGVPETWCTPEHPVWGAISRQTNHSNYLNKISPLHWIPAHDLKKNNFYKDVGSLVFTPSFDQPASSSILLRPEALSKNKQQAKAQGRIPFTLQLDDELRYFFGVYLAEGNLATRGIALTFGYNENELAVKVARIGEKKFNVKPSWRRDEHIIRLTFCSIILRDFFMKTFYRTSHHAEGKFVPFHLMPMSEAMLEGLRDGDGGEYGGETQIVTVSPSLMFQTFLSLQILGKQARIRKRKEDDVIQGRHVNVQPAWDVRYRDPPLKNSLVKSAGGYLRSITRIKTKLYKGWVYNFDVTRDHSYTVNGVAVHNCLPHYPASWKDFEKLGPDGIRGLDVWDGVSLHLPDEFAILAACAVPLLRGLQEEFYVELHFMLEEKRSLFRRSFRAVDAAVSFTSPQVRRIVDTLRSWERNIPQLKGYGEF